MAAGLPPDLQRLRQALAAELPSEVLGVDEHIVEYLGEQLRAADGAEGALAEAWLPFLASLGICGDGDAVVAKQVCGRVLARLGGVARAGTLSPALAPAHQGDDSSRVVAQPAVHPEVLEWLEKLKLTKYAEQVKAWSLKSGALSLAEISTRVDELLEKVPLKTLEEKRVRKWKEEQERPAEPVVTRECFGPPSDPEKYAFGRRLGEGATAKVHECLDNKSQATHAVKIVSLAKQRLLPDFQKLTDKLRREVSILLALRHPRIVSLHEVIEVPDSRRPEKLYLVMECVHGGELFERIVKARALSENTSRYVFSQIAEGLQYIHSKDIVHRDLKPENILVDEVNSRQDFLEVKISDFGYAKLINDGYSTPHTMVGTPQYRAPEVMAGNGHDQRVDLWSLGVLLYVMLIGSYPFNDSSPSTLDPQSAPLEFRTSALGTDISDNAKDLIRALVKVDAQQRLTLPRCRAHRWVTSKEGGGRHYALQKLETEIRPDSLTVLKLPAAPSKSQVDLIRRDLHIWMTKFHCSAKVANHEIVATLGYGSKERLASAREELQQIVDFNFGTGGSCAPGPRQAWCAGLGPERGYPGEPAVAEPERVLSCTLRVHPDHGSGLYLIAERGGMRIRDVCEEPGQTGLKANDLIVAINEVSLRATGTAIVEQIFGSHFGNGAKLSILR